MKILLATITAVLLASTAFAQEKPFITIWRAASRGFFEDVKQHLAAGTSVDAKDQFGKTPLHHAAEAGQKEMVELLIASGGDVNAKDDILDWSPLDRAGRNDHSGIVALLRKHGGEHGNVHGTAVGGDIESVKQYLKTGTNANVKDKIEATPLHWAVAEGRMDVAQLLLGKRAT